jgi:D-beta-D-heptose 7-phosphate kinase/D-beta-D-heptose 1-phosphate adenosyltransferase
MLDRYLNGKVSRISPEAPVPVINYIDEKNILGGAANVANNIIALKQNVSLMSVVGADETADKLVEMLNENNINTEFIIKDKQRVTTQKIRVLGDNKQQLLRIDKEIKVSISSEVEDYLIQCLQENIKRFDCVVLSDYLKGVLTDALTYKIVNICNASDIPVIVDPKSTNLSKYMNSYLCKPNKIEFNKFINKNDNTKITCDDMLGLKTSMNVKNLVVTCGSEGMILLDENDDYYEIQRACSY